jgi:hypothetical protein
MSAGTGVTHSEFNASQTDPVHLLQIWIRPEAKGIKPSYEQRPFAREDLRGRLCLIAAREPVDGAVKIHQDVRLFATILDGETIKFVVPKDRYAWLQVARGTMNLNGVGLMAGDGAAVSDTAVLEISGSGEALIFDLL